MTDEAREQIKQDCQQDEAKAMDAERGKEWPCMDDLLDFLTDLARCALCFQVCDRDLMKEVDLDVRGNKQLLCEDCHEAGQEEPHDDPA